MKITDVILRAFESGLIREPSQPGTALLILVEPDGFVASAPVAQEFLDDSDEALAIAAAEIKRVRQRERG